MLSSSIRTIKPVMETILFLNPKKVLDLGFGFGKNGFLIREYLFENDFFDSHLYLRGVEGYSNHIKSLHKILYNDVVHCDFTQISNYIKDNDHFDLAIMIDTYEHIDRKTGIEFLEKLLDISDYILISVSRFLSKQNGYDDDSNNKMFLLTKKKPDQHKRILKFKRNQLLKKFSPGIIFDLKSYFYFLSNRKDYL